jgi:hypothetical protein
MVFEYMSEWAERLLTADAGFDPPPEACGQVDRFSGAVCTLTSSQHEIHHDRSEWGVQFLWNDKDPEQQDLGPGDGSVRGMLGGQ